MSCEMNEAAAPVSKRKLPVAEYAPLVMVMPGGELGVAGNRGLAPMIGLLANDAPGAPGGSIAANELKSAWLTRIWKLPGTMPGLVASFTASYGVPGE